MAKAGSGKAGKAEAKPYAAGLGKTIQRLRKAYKMSLGDLSEQSGVAKSIISQIERNETNPTLGTVWRLTEALDTTVEDVLRTDTRPVFLEHAGKSATPVLMSEDGLCRLTIIGALDVVGWVQWYDFRAKPGGRLESEPHQMGSSEHLSVLKGALEVTVGGETRLVKAGETLRYRADRDHVIANTGKTEAHATMVVVLKVTVM